MKTQQQYHTHRLWPAAALLTVTLSLFMVLRLANNAAADQTATLTVLVETTPARGRPFHLIHDLLTVGGVEIYGEPGSGPGQFDTPRGIAFDDLTSQLYLVDASNHRVQVWELEYGEGGYQGLFYSRAWGSQGAAAGLFLDPYDIAVDADGNLYVTDTGRPVVQKFTPDGDYLGPLGSQGSGPGQFLSPTGIAIDESGHIYVGDQDNGNVQVFDADGTYVRTLGNARGPGQFGNPAGIAIAEDGRVVVVDYATHNVQTFNTAGDLLATWGEFGTNPGQFRHPFGVALGHLDQLYISDAQGVQVFNTHGDFLGRFETPAAQQPGTGFADLAYNIADHLLYIVDQDQAAVLDVVTRPAGVQLGDADTVRYTYNSQPVTTTLSLLDIPAGWELAPITCAGGAANPLPSGVAIAIQPGDQVSCTVTLDGPAAALTIAAADYENPATSYAYSLDPGGLNFATEWGGTESQRTLFNFPGDIAMDPGGMLHIANGTNILIYDASGAYMGQWGSQGIGDGQFQTANAIAITPAGLIYVADTSMNRIQVFDDTGHYLGQFGGPGPAEGQFNGIGDVVLDGDGNLYVTDREQHRVQVFDAAGEFIRMWGWGVADGAAAPQVCTSGCQPGIWGTGPGQLSFPYSIAVDPLGQVFVTNNGNYHIQVFDRSGTYRELRGDAVNWQAELAVDVAGNLYAMQEMVRKYDLDGGLLAAAGYRGVANDELANPAGLAVAANGDVYALVYPWGSGVQFGQLYRQGDLWLGHGDSQRYEIAVGAYLITELSPAADPPAITCSGGSPMMRNNQVWVMVGAGDDTVCTFTRGTPPLLPNQSYLPVVR